MRGFYRWHVADPIFFEEDLKVTVQQIGVGHKGLFERQDDLSSVAYWYQKEPHNKFRELLPKEKAVAPADERLKDKYAAGRLKSFSRPAAYYTEAARSASTSSTESVT